MKNVFIYGNSYEVSKFVYAINFMTNLNANKVILLKENMRKYFSLYALDFQFYDTTEECLTHADVTIILKTKYIPEEKMQRLIGILNSYEKKYYIIDEDSIDKEKCDVGEMKDFASKPVILIINFGNCAASLECELLVEKIFFDRKILISHYYSLKNHKYLKCLSRLGLLSEELKGSLENRSYAPVIVKCIECEREPILLRKHFDEIGRYMADYVIFTTDLTYHDYSELLNISKYICNRKLDAWIKSRYYDFGESELISHINKLNTCSPAFDIESYNISDILAFEIFSKIAYPLGIVKYR